MIDSCCLSSQSLLAFGVLRLHTKIFANWQILYLAEALPSLIMAAIILLFLPAFPFTAKFLTKRQRVIAVARLRDHRPKSHGGGSGWEAVKLVLKDPHTWGFVIVYSSCEYKPKASLLPQLVNFALLPSVVGFLSCEPQQFSTPTKRNRSLYFRTFVSPLPRTSCLRSVLSGPHFLPSSFISLGFFIAHQQTRLQPYPNPRSHYWTLFYGHALCLVPILAQ